MNGHILVADDEPSVREAVTLALEREGFLVTACEDGRGAWESLSTKKGIDLAILDILMGDLEGTAVLSRLRASGSTLPVILLTSRDEEIDRISGFSMGADDYIGKPFSIRELCARVKAVLRRSQAQQAEAPGAGGGAHGVPGAAGPVATPTEGIAIDARAYRAWCCGAELCLTISEFRLLEAFCENAGSALSREQLLERAWPMDGFIAERSVDSHVKRLRKKLEEAGADGDLIQTVYGLGYRMRGLPPRAR